MVLSNVRTELLNQKANEQIARTIATWPLCSLSARESQPLCGAFNYLVYFHFYGDLWQFMAHTRLLNTGRIINLKTAAKEHTHFFLEIEH